MEVIRDHAHFASWLDFRNASSNTREFAAFVALPLPKGSAGHLPSHGRQAAHVG
jgi:hypothetical protein